MDLVIAEGESLPWVQIRNFETTQHFSYFVSYSKWLTMPTPIRWEPQRSPSWSRVVHRSFRFDSLSSWSG